MEKLNLELFIKAAKDAEYSKYKLLAIMNKYMDYLHHSKLYPVFSNLIEIKSILRGIIDSRSELESGFHKRLLRFDLKKKKPVYSNEDIFNLDDNAIFDFINWSLPQIQDGLNEGKAIYDFVEENSTIRQVGIIPLYKNEGYLLIADYMNKSINVYRYEMVLFAATEEPLRTLRTKYLESYELCNLEILVKDIKLQLAKQFPELPNPAAYLFSSEIDFPFKETILPIAKRKLMKTLAA